MTPFRLILRSLFFHWRINVSVAFGVTAATAVLTGALLVGDSMRGSLRDLTLDRLGKVDQVLLTERFFRAELAGEVSAAEGFDSHFDAALPVILLQTTIEDLATQRRAAQVTTLGVDEDFWRLDPGRDYPTPEYDEIVINRKLADELGIEKLPDKEDENAKPVEVMLRLARASQIPADSPLGRKVEQMPSRRLTVSHIIPNEGLGRFSLQSNQQTPLVAFVALEMLQSRSVLDQADKVNAIVIVGKQRDAASGPEATQLLSRSLKPTLADYGIAVEHVQLAEPSDVVSEYVNISCDQMVLPPYVAEVALTELNDDNAQPAITYLANWIRTADGKAAIPYSTVTAIDSNQQLGPLFRENGKPLVLADDQIVLNSWAAQDMADQGRPVQRGDRIELVFFEPESTHGEAQEREESFLLADVAQLAEPGEIPTPVTDSHFTPVVPGLTDQKSIDDWDPPFPYYARRVRSTPPNNQDDQYWKDHRATPKAFISYAAGEKLWHSRFGAVTTIRIPIAGDHPPAEQAERGESGEVGQDNPQSEIADRLREAISPAELGFAFRPVKQQALQAASGTTPFAGLFIGFSFFIIAAAVMLVALLFQLGMQQRASQIGVMQAVGLARRMTGRLLSREGLLVAAAGGGLGILIGIGYAWLMVAGLNSPDWWGQAIATPFLALHLENPLTYIIGFLFGVVIAWLTIVISVWLMGRASIRGLMSGKTDQNATRRATQRVPGVSSLIGPPLAKIFGVLLFIAAIGMFFLASALSGEAQAGAFFGGGAAVLTAALLLVWAWLRGQSSSAAIASGGAPLLRLALRNAKRNPGRSTLTIGLVASATFLIVAISAFRLDPDEKGAGGFDVIAQSNRPILPDLNTPEGRRELRIAGAAADALNDSTVIALRVKGGDDASCLNLYQSQQPRILGVSDEVINYFGRDDTTDFAWAGTVAETPEETANPWLLLRREKSGGRRTERGERRAEGGERQVEEIGFRKSQSAIRNPIPVVIDKNTAMYSLHLYGGPGSTFELTDDQGQQLEFRIVGLLANSVLQGSLLIGEEDFKRLYPQISGRRMFLAKANVTNVTPAELVEAMESSLSEQGMDATDCRARLRDLLAVQNTYLSTFQSIGALGLLLGTFGLATVQLRSVLERRGELALMRSAGFRRTRLARMVMLENMVLLVGGLSIGLVAALLAVLPHWLAGGAAVPLLDLALYLGVVLMVGVVSSLAAVAATLRAPLLDALRGA